MSILDTLSSPFSCSTAHIITSHNPIQLAAISNFKLAQLTFAPPDLHSLRKTAIIKNVIEDIYSNTPSDWLQQMTRWQYLTPESLEEMTQEGLEEIFAQYAQAIEAFRPVRSISTLADSEENDIFSNEVDDGRAGDDLWVADDCNRGFAQYQQRELQEENPITETKACSTEITSPALFLQPNATISDELIVAGRAASPLSDKPLPAQPMSFDTSGSNTASVAIAVVTKARRKSTFGGSKNRLSWTSDTGITSSAVSQNLANEIMSLFDMDFAIDINLDTAPKLPELPFKPKNDNRKSLHRQSQDMLTSLIPAFEKIALETTMEFNNYRTSHSTPNLSRAMTSVPQRSSSLRYRQQEQSESFVSPLAVVVPSPAIVNKNKSKKKNILRLASSLMGGKKTSPLLSPKSQLSKDKLPNSPELSSDFIKEYSSSSISSIANSVADPSKASSRKASTSTVETIISSTLSSSWSNISADHVEMKAVVKPLPETLSTATKATAQVHSNKRNSRRKHSTKKKRRSARIEKTMIKRKRDSHHHKPNLQTGDSEASILEATATNSSTSSFLVPFGKGLSRSKSAFIKIGHGLKSKKSYKKQLRRVSSVKHLNEALTGSASHKEINASQITDPYVHCNGNDTRFNGNKSAPILVATAFSEEPQVRRQQLPLEQQSFVKRMTSFHWKMKSRGDHSRKSAAEV
ncbi:hypothetical protein BDF20DRAFT_890133 [Mycotypha africana]|uniref:uncharacterized protein n=1 Tax=Mycotypha africana TaxID=64632 RepID=UPI0023002410|nr:uncharacterized protein BDF20DRAFT_890133 [Mycotypha africana]KAI8970252.1 hypothetical protein BDF20DRAFT_890133 [Mycotypha africana]